MAILFCLVPLNAAETTETTPAEDENQANAEGGTSGNPLANPAALAKLAEANKPQKCDIYLMRSMGFQGHENAKEMKLDMCPDIEKSCCALKDQLLIYKYWMLEGEEAKIDERFKLQREIYEKLLDNLNNVYDRAQTVHSLVETDKVRRNCKILTRKILKYSIKDVGPQLKSKMNSMHEFFKTSYKGFYCSICDAKNDKFLKTAGNQFVMDRQFCRDIVSHSLHSLLYLHIYLMKYLNIVSQFLSGCDAKGNFKETIIAGVYRFAVEPKTFRVLKNCKLNVNEPNSWFSGCRKICEKFTFAKFSEFFEPHLDKFKKYNTFIQDNLQRLENEAKKAETPKKEQKAEGGEENKPAENAEGGDTVKVEQKVRVLTETTPAPANTENKPAEGQNAQPAAEGDPAKKEATLEEMIEVDISKELDETLKDLFGHTAIFNTVIGSTINLQAFESRYKEKGMNPYETGKSTVINESQIKAIEDEVLKQEEEEAITEDSGATNTEAQTAETEAPRTLLRASLSQVGVIATLFLLFMTK